MMRAGNTTEAELEFQQIAVAYPQFAGADINLGILYRKTARLEQSEQALRAAVERESANAVAWNELGVTLRMRGEFRDAADAYRHAISADAGFAPAYRNLGVLLDLYMGDAPGALAALEHYKELTGEEKPVTGWIAELRQRTGKKAPQPAAAPAPPSETEQPSQGTAPAPNEAPAPAKDKAGE
jgi:Flp pilus assembly protein TadD